MAATIQQLCGLGLVRQSSQAVPTPCHGGMPKTKKASPAYPHLTHTVLKESLWIDGLQSPFWVDESLRRNFSLQAQDGELFGDSNDFHYMHSPCFFNDEGAAFVASLRVCTKNKDLYIGTRLHNDILERGLLERCSDALVTMYAKCGALAKAKELLDMHKSRDVISWTALIAGYALQGQSRDALDCYDQMQHEGLSPDAVTFACCLKACGSLNAADKGKQIHVEISRQGLLRNDVVLGTALVDMYAKCGSLAKAQCLLEELPYRDVASWNSLIAGYAQVGQGEQALKCFEQMLCEGLSPDAKTFTSILNACGTSQAVEKGEQIHDEIVRHGILGNDIVLGNALVGMYAKCGRFAKAHHVLEELPSRDVVTWSALIASYTEQDQGEQALNCFERMQSEGLLPDAVTFMCILKTCGTLGAINKGEKIHDEIARQGLLMRNNIMLGTALVDMYAKCGALGKAQHVLEELPFRNVVSWSALIAGYTQHGQDEKALHCFECMQREGFSPDTGTFSSVLNACSHLGLVEDGYKYFMSISTNYGLKPDLEHYTCIVDLLGRAGHLDKAVRVIEEMPSSGSSAVWRALLGACRKWGDVQVGKWAFEKAVQVDRSDGSAHILMTNIYAGVSMQEDAKP